MRLSISNTLLYGIAALTPSVDGFGFTDTSPFFFFSTRDIPFSSSSLRSSSSLLSALKDSLSICPSDFYLLINQPGVHVSDFTSKRAMPRLKSKLLKDDEGIKSSAAVDEVVCTTGKTSVEGMNIVGVKDDSLRRMLEEKCGAETVVVDGMDGNIPSPQTYPRRPTVIQLNFQAPTATDRFDQLYLNDAIIASLIELLPSSNYTVVYSTTPVDLTIPFPLDSEPESGKQSGDDDSSSSNNSEPPTVRYKFNEYDDEVYHGAEKLLNLQVKRDTNAYQGRNDDDDDGDAKKGHHSIPGGVFERYQFLSPGIFMGFFAAFFFIIIIYVGISAITSLEISYGSFARDTSPQSAKKTQ